MFYAQSIQSARLSLPSSELGPSPESGCCPPFGSKGGDTRWRGGSGGPNSNKETDTIAAMYIIIPLRSYHLK
jgi:hypothetical protein